MALRVFLLGAQLASIVATAYLLWSGLWFVIIMAIGFGLLTTAITALVNLPMAE